MAGTSFTINWQVWSIIVPYSRVLRGAMSKGMYDMGSELIEMFRNEILSQGSSAVAWPPLAESTIKRKQKEGVTSPEAMLLRRWEMIDSFRMTQTSDNSIGIGTRATPSYSEEENLIKILTHEFGAPNTRFPIPERSFIRPITNDATKMSSLTDIFVNLMKFVGTSRIMPPVGGSQNAGEMSEDTGGLIQGY